jgi:hypothetical protein
MEPGSRYLRRFANPAGNNGIIHGEREKRPCRHGEMVFVDRLADSGAFRIIFYALSMKKQFQHAWLFTTCFFCAACTHYSPKPTGYYRIQLPEATYRWQAFPAFDCCISEHAQIAELPLSGEGEFFNLVYPHWNAQIYCSYFIIKKDNLMQLSEESRKFVYLHAVKADAIRE